MWDGRVGEKSRAMSGGKGERGGFSPLVPESVYAACRHSSTNLTSAPEPGIFRQSDLRHTSPRIAKIAETIQNRTTIRDSGT